MADERTRSLAALGYELLERLGSGGMGQVWRARDVKLERDIAIKFIADSLTDARSSARFQVEARALARVSHANVVAVHQLGEHAGQPFLVYELVEGASLDTLIGELSWQRALDIVLDLARGLAAVHQAGILHRDLKPANVMVTADGTAKLIDFGVAKLAGGLLDEQFDALRAPPQPPVSVTDLNSTLDISGDLLAPTLHSRAPGSGITQTNALLGTPRYIAPELWLGKPASPVTDVYALGLIAWELLTGRHAHAVDGVELMRTIVERPLPSVAELCPDLPSELAALIDRAVSKRAIDRFASAEAFAGALERVAEQLQDATEDSVRTRRTRRSRGHAGADIPAAPPPTRWIRAGQLSIALQQFGEGPLDLIVSPAWVSHCEAAWRLPDYASFMHRLGRVARVTVFDKRGTGMSDRINASIPIEQRMLDIDAILDALGIEAAALLGIQDGGAIATMFAACRPERVRGLIWYAAARRLLQADDYPFGMPADMFEQVCAAVEPNWGAPLFAEFVAPSRADDPEYLAWWADYIRNGASPSTARWMLELNATIDIAPLLPAIGVPTLVMHRRGDRMMPLPGGKLVADGILDARWVELDGDDHQPWLSDSEAVLAEIGRFLTELPGLPRHDRRSCSLLAHGGDVEFHTGPVEAMRRALDARFDGPALIHMGSTQTEPEQHARRLLAELDGVAAGTVLATSEAVSLSGGAQLEFEAFAWPTRDPLFRVRRA